jgi:hypothetical protein
LTALLERLRSPARKALRQAGPPDLAVVAGFAVSGLLILVGWWSGALHHVPWPWWALIPIVILAVISFADRDGWNVRRAMAYVAIRQRARWTGGPIPRGPTGARAWLEDPANADADGLQKVSMLINIGNLAAGRTVLDAYVPSTDIQAAAVIRLRSHLAAFETGSIDMAPIRAATEGLDQDERRYQLTSAAWTQAWRDIETRHPWRPRFADTIRDLGPYPVQGRILAFIGFQQLAPSFATAIATAIVAGIAGW